MWEQEADENVAKIAARCLAALDELIPSRPEQELSEIAELRASGVGESRIQALYPLDGKSYIAHGAFSRLSDRERDLMVERLSRLDFRLTVRPLLKPEHRSPSEPLIAQLADFCLELERYPLAQILASKDILADAWGVHNISAILERAVGDLEEVVAMRRARSKLQRSAGNESWLRQQIKNALSR